MKKLTPRRAIHLKCLDCSCGHVSEIKLCPADGCPLFYYRSGHRGPNQPSPLKAIRAKCLDCSETLDEIKNCSIKSCVLQSYRMGHNPARIGTGPSAGPSCLKRPTPVRISASDLVPTSSDASAEVRHV